MNVLDSWFVLAFATPIIWAIICLIDTCVVGNNIYRSAWDGPVISGLFSAVPLAIWLVITPETTPNIVEQHGIEHSAIVAAGLAGLMYFLHVYFYFRALFRLNDVANTESVMALSVVVVPVFAWFVLGERLSGAFYAAISIASIGLIITARSTLCSLEVTISLTLAVLCISLSMVLQAKALEQLSFSQVTIVYSAVTLTLSITALLLNASYRRQLSQMLQRYYPIFLIAESIEATARLTGQRAIEIGPSVTAVALIQSTLPIIIVLFSLMLVGTDRVRQFLSPVLRETLALQSESMQTKATLFAVTVAAVLILQLDGAL